MTLTWDVDQPVDPAALAPALARPARAVWSGVTVGANEPVDGVWLRLTATEAGTCRITADAAAVETGLCAPVIPALSPAVVDGGSFAYLTARRVEAPSAGPGEGTGTGDRDTGGRQGPDASSSDGATALSSGHAGEPRWELGAAGHGPAGELLAQRVRDQVLAWHHDRHATPVITAEPVCSPGHRPPGGPAIDKGHIRLTISY